MWDPFRNYLLLGLDWNESRVEAFEVEGATFCTVPLKRSWHDGIVRYDVAWSGQVIHTPDGPITPEILLRCEDTKFLAAMAAIRSCFETREMARESGAEVH